MTPRVVEGASAQLLHEIAPSHSGQTFDPSTADSDWHVMTRAQIHQYVGATTLDWKSASRKIRSPNLLTYRFFARYRHWSAGGPQTAWSGCTSLCPMSWR